MAIGSVPPPPPPALPPPYTYPPIIIILTIILLVFFFFGFFSIYFCRCFVENILCTWHLRHSPTGTPAGGAAPSGGGLDPFLVQSFPAFTYSTVKDYSKEKYGLECAICLVEFQGNDVLRLLTTCYHVFHQECIDLWLESHKTCPVCRRNLDSSPATNNILEHNIHENDEQLPLEDSSNSISITVVKDENDNSETRMSDKGQRDSSFERHAAQSNVEKLSKSHSTGHSIDIINRDRFTLVLPQHVKSHIIKGHNPSQSWPTFGEYKIKSSTK